MIKNIAVLLVLGLILGACSDNDAVVTVAASDPDVTVSGGGVKGPLIDAIAELYELDFAATNFKGALLASGSTNEMAELQGITVPASAGASFLLEITADENTRDLTSNAAPIFVNFRTVVSSEDIQSGQIYATPVTTLALALAEQSGPFASITEFNEAKLLSAQKVLSTFGFGLDTDTDPFTSNPLVTASDTTDEQQARVLAYRTAIEGLAAIINLLTTEITAGGGTVSADDVLTAVAMDLSDDAIDGQSSAGAIEALGQVANISAVITTAPAMLMVPGTDTPITMLASIVTAETTTTGVTVSTEAISSGRVAIAPTPARSNPDIDDDGVNDRDDQFPSDANEVVDTDGDGTGNNADTDDDGDGALDTDDAFPLDAAERLDTDGDDIGNNADTDDDGDGVDDDMDALPLDDSETIDTDGDGMGDNADSDDDGDGSQDTADAFPLDASETIDTDDDGTGNNADTDDDGDGVADADDNLPLDPQGSVATSRMIGANGGTITSPDGLMSLTIPANAVSEDTLITIGSPTAAASAEFDSDELPLDALYLLGPDGQQFAEPVIVTWTIPSSSNQPDTVRLVATVSDGVAELVPADVVMNPFTGEVSTSVTHFSEILFFTGTYKIVINSPTARKGGVLYWEYEVLEAGDAVNRRGPEVTTENFPDSSVLVPPELLSGTEVISELQHVSGLFYPADEAETGTITAICADASVEGLKARIGFNVQWSESIAVFGIFANPSEQAGLIRVEAIGTCREFIEITEPTFIPIGDDIDRITEAPLGVVTEQCGFEATPYYVVVSGTRTSVINTAGSCSQDLNFDPNENSIFGAQALVADGAQRLFIYGESGVFIVQLIDGVFGQLSDFQSTTTDIQHRVNDDGSQISDQAYSVNNRGEVKLRTLLADGTNTNVVAFNAFGATGEAFIAYTPISLDTGVGIASGTPSTAYYVDITSNSAVEIGEVGDTALGINCERLVCDASSSSCSATNNETVGCVATAFDSEEVYTFFANDVLTHTGATPTFNFTGPIPGIKTASPYTRSNAQGQLVTATVNTNEIGKVRLSIQNPDGTEVQAAEFFLPDYNDAIAFAGVGTSIVLMLPSAEYPNGAVRIGVDEPNGSGDGLLTIPVTEALLGTFPEPFFGPAFVTPQ